MSIAIQNNMVFTPLMINDIISLLKNETIDLNDKAMFTSIYKILEIARDELHTNSKTLEEAYYTPEKYKIDALNAYETLSDAKDKLWKLHDNFEDSTNVYEIQLFNIIDESLDYITKILNILSYFSNKEVA